MLAFILLVVCPGSEVGTSHEALCESCATGDACEVPSPLEDEQQVSQNAKLDTDDSINTKCPFSGSPIVAGSLGLYNGRVVGFCNPGCRDKFVNDPAEWPEAIAYFDTLIAEMDEWHKPWADVEKALKEGNVANVWQKPEVSIIVYAPKGRDNQSPHNRDEVYMVISGSGKFQYDGETVDFKTGDMLFAAKGKEHRFVDFTEDFKTWVVFYGDRS